MISGAYECLNNASPAHRKQVPESLPSGTLTTSLQVYTFLTKVRKSALDVVQHSVSNPGPSLANGSIYARIGL